MLVSLTGPSGVGKTTLMHNLLRTLPEAQPLVSYTTRARRESDEPGEYRYVSEAEFEAMLKRGELLWEARTTGNRYGTKTADIDAALAGGLYLPILVPEAVEKLFAYARERGKTDAVKFLYIRIDDEAELRRRLEQRGDDPQEIEARLVQCRSWNESSERSEAPFVFLHAAARPEEVLAQALTALRAA